MIGTARVGWVIVTGVGIVDGLAAIAFRGVGPSAIGYALVTVLITTVALRLIAVGTGLPSRWHWPAILALGLWVEHLSSLVEAVAFDVITIAAALGEAGLGVLLMLPLAWVATRGGAAETSYTGPGRSPLAWGYRGAACVVVFAIAYLVAGALVYPFVHDFYAGRPLPSPGALLVLQFIRGSVLLVLSAPLLAWSQHGRTARVFRWAAALALLAGVAPLLTPNPAFPDPVRYAHMLEIVGSHLVVGIAFALLMGPPLRRGHARMGLSARR